MLFRSRVLSTLNADGSRRWMDPREASGAWHRRRTMVAWTLIAVFTLLPWLRIDGKPPILLDVMTRHFTLLGTTFRPTETPLIAVLMAMVFVTVFLLTALAGANRAVLELYTSGGSPAFTWTYDTTTLRELPRALRLTRWRCS